jgi:hypothetical protein
MDRTPGGAVVADIDQVMREVLPDAGGGNSLADHFEDRKALLPPAAIVVARAAVGLPTRPPGQANGWRFVALAGSGAVIALPPGGEL